MCWCINTYIHTHAFSPFVWYFKVHKVFSYMISLEPYNSPVTCKRHCYTHFRDEKMRPREVNELPMISQLMNHRVKPGVQDFCFPGLTFFYWTLLSHEFRVLSIKDEVGSACRLVEPAGAKAQRQKCSETAWICAVRYTQGNSLWYVRKITWGSVHRGH